MSNVHEQMREIDRQLVQTDTHLGRMLWLVRLFFILVALLSLGYVAMVAFHLP